MKANIVNLKSLFGSPVSFQIPPFQRPYAWKENEQWMPLWEDVRNVAEKLAKNGNHKIRPHFMGAIVLQQRESDTGEVTKRLVIDGQQRLTTLQLLIKATQRVFQGENDNDRANRLRDLTENEAKHWGNDQNNKTKIRQSNRNDQKDFNEAIDFHARDTRNDGDPILRALNFFQENVETWFRDSTFDRTSQADALENTLTEQLQFAVIDLDQEEEPHIIFETLNARGEPLEQSDLIKNTVMYKANVIDDVQVAKELWGMFEENTWWRQFTGEQNVKRIQLDRFLNHWMVVKTRKEISHHRVAAEFREFCDSSTLDIKTITTEIGDAGDQYRKMLEIDDPDREIKRFLVRLRALDLNSAMPLLLWLKTSKAENEQIKKCFQIIESYLVRRMLCGYFAFSLGSVVVALMNKLHDESPNAYDVAIVNHLKSATTTTTVWPRDRMLLESIENKPISGTIPRRKMVLEALEFDLRSDKSEEIVSTTNLTLEHIMPQKWETHWPIPSSQEIEQRQEAVRWLGNLTLTTSKLNASLSNAPWDEKRQALENHSSLFLNKELLHVTEWNEEAIRKRTAELAQRIVKIWKSADYYTGGD